MLIPFGQNLYLADGPTVSFFGFPYPTRMAVARLSTGKAWVWSPIALTKELIDAVESIKLRSIPSGRTDSVPDPLDQASY